MDFLNKLYSSEYFGIGLFCVIAFLVVTFLVVLFFGKKDEKKRKLEETNRLETVNEVPNAFQETTTPTPVEVPVENVAATLEPVTPIAPVEYEPVASETAVIEEKTDFVQNLTMEETPVIEPVVISEVPTDAPVVVEQEKEIVPVEPIINPVEPQVEITPIENIQPINIEPIHVDVPEEPIKEEIVTPILEEKVEPIVFEQPTPDVVEETVEPTSYYQDPVKIDEPSIDVPNIDFDAIAKSISKELDDLENINKVQKEEPLQETVKPAEQFSSVYINRPANVNVAPKTKIVLPKKIELPSTKEEAEIEPESYQI